MRDGSMLVMLNNARFFIRKYFIRTYKTFEGQMLGTHTKTI